MPWNVFRFVWLLEEIDHDEEVATMTGSLTLFHVISIYPLLPNYQSYQNRSVVFHLYTNKHMLIKRE